MQAMRKPIWVFLTITLPQMIILAALGKIFSVIRPLMNEWQVSGWKIFGAVILLFIVSATAYAILCLIRKKEIASWFGIVVFSVYVPIIYVSLFLRGDLIPASVPGWMMFDLEPVIVLEALIVPALAYGMLLSVYWLTPQKGETKVVNDIIWTISIPCVFYIIFTVIIPWLNGSGEILEHAAMILFVLGSIAFLFFLIRIIYIFLCQKPDFWKKLILPAVLIFPLLGLSLNHSIYDVFGDFSHPGFFIAAAVCGILLILPEWEKPQLRLLVFLGKMLLLPYTVYFFFVFLPYVPVAIPAILAVGTGFLILTPTLLFLIHIRSVNIDLSYLREHYKIKKVLTAGVLSVLVIPLGITAFYYRDRVNLGKAMVNAINPSYQTTEPVRVNRNGIRRTLAHIEQNTGRNGFGFPVFTQQTPLLSAWYRFIVLDNLFLSGDKSDLISQVILGEPLQKTDASPVTQEVELLDITVDTTYDAGEKTWHSWVNVTLKNSVQPMAEYRTQFTLPEGCYISNYYLYVNGEKKFGLLADKRAAEWIYRQITTINRDPGLLRYIGNNMLELRVFPFQGYETRRTGFEVIHKEPAVITLDGRTVELAGESLEEPVVLDKAVYLPASAKKELESVIRENRWFFLVDITDKEKTETYLKRAEAFISEHNFAKNTVEVIAVNDNLWTAQFGDEGLKIQKDVAWGGGFYADKAIKTVLYGTSINNGTRPVFILVSDSLENAIIRDDLDVWQAAVPEGDELYHLDASGDLFTYPMKDFDATRGVKTQDIKPVPVLAWPSRQNPLAYVPDDGKASVIVAADSGNPVNTPIPQTSWEKAVVQQAEYFQAIKHPEKKTENQFNLVKSSIASGILSPYTAYIVLENEAQENMLREKQKQILAAKSDFDLGENLPEETEMTEPGLLIMAVLFMALLLVKKRKTSDVK